LWEAKVSAILLCDFDNLENFFERRKGIEIITFLFLKAKEARKHGTRVEVSTHSWRPL
jgi:hypothetical protein